MDASIKYKINQRSCCDSFKRHKKKIIKTLRRVSIEMQQKYPEYNLNVDQQICRNCHIKLCQSIHSSPSNDSISFHQIQILIIV